MNQYIKNAFYVSNPNFKKMMKIILDFRNNPALDMDNLEKHHIVPRAYFRAVGVPVDNSQDNLVKLPFNMHCLVHFYAAQCSKPVIQDAMNRAMNNFFKIKNITEEFVLAHKDELNKGKKTINKNAWKEWAKENDQENYKRYLEHQKEKEIRTLKKKFNLSFSVHYPQSARTCIATLKRISKRLGEKKREYKKVICVTTGEIFESTGDAGRKMGLSGLQISTLCRHSGRHRTVKGFVFEYLENYDPKKLYIKKEINQDRFKAVFCIEMNKVYKSISFCSRELKCNPTGIALCCNGKIKTLKGFHFRWAK